MPNNNSGNGNDFGNEEQNPSGVATELPRPALVTVIDATYITTGEGGVAEFIGLWYRDETAAHLLFFPMDRVDILDLKEGDKGTLASDKGVWEFTPRKKPLSGFEAWWERRKSYHP